MFGNTDADYPESGDYVYLGGSAGLPGSMTTTSTTYADMSNNSNYHHTIPVAGIREGKFESFVVVFAGPMATGVDTTGDIRLQRELNGNWESLTDCTIEGINPSSGYATRLSSEATLTDLGTSEDGAIRFRFEGRVSGANEVVVTAGTAVHIYGKVA